jgi:hypothetical protein
MNSFLADGTRAAYTPAGESTYTPTPEGVEVYFNGAGCAVTSSSKLVTWDQAEVLAKNADFGGGYRVALANRPPSVRWRGWLE